MKRSSVLFTELDRRLSLSNNNQNKRKYKEENKKCRKNRQKEKQRDFDKGTIKSGPKRDNVTKVGASGSPHKVFSLCFFLQNLDKKKKTQGFPR